jgi:hypothetical protein
MLALGRDKTPPNWLAFIFIVVCRVAVVRRTIYRTDKTSSFGQAA